MRLVIAGGILSLAIQCVYAPPCAAEEALMDRGGCISCHRLEQKLLGPSFKEVAARYRDDPLAVERLFTKVREGGEGEWGDLPMQPNDEKKISDADLRALLAWILKL